MKKTLLGIVFLLGCGALFLAVGVFAAATVPDIIEMKADYEHTKDIVQFNHKKHSEEYKATCGDCHHDDQNKPLNDLKAGDPVQKCFECHNKPGEKPKGKDAPKLSKKERRQYHAEAIHENCKNCHKKFNKENKTKRAPTTCKKCHPKSEDDKE